MLLLAISSPLLALGLLFLMDGYERWTLDDGDPGRIVQDLPRR